MARAYGKCVFNVCELSDSFPNAFSHFAFLATLYDNSWSSNTASKPDIVFIFELYIYMVFPGGSSYKESACQCRKHEMRV